MRRICVASVVVAVMAGAGALVAVGTSSVDSASAAPGPAGVEVDVERTWTEAWGFEPGERFSPGYIHGQEAWGSLGGSASEAFVEIANPRTGTQHLRITDDPDRGLAVAMGTVSPYAHDSHADSSSVSVWVSIATLGGGDFDVSALAPSQGFAAPSQGLSTATVIFRSIGDIAVLDVTGFGVDVVDTGSDWTQGSYVQLVIDVDPVADTITYWYGGTQIYTSAGGLFGGTVIEQVAFSKDFGGGHADFDDLVIDRGLSPLIVDLHRWSFTTDGADSAGGADAVLHNGAGVVGGALVLDGADDYAVLPIAATLASLTDVSVEMWTTWTGGRSWERFFDFGNDTNVYWFMTPRSSHTDLPRVAITTGSYNTEQRTDAPDPFPLGTPTHVVFTLAGNDVAYQSRLYVNGTRVATHSETSPLDPAELGTLANLWLGRSQYPPDPYFMGSIDEFAICSGVLGDLDVLERYRGVFFDGFESGGTTHWSATMP